MDGLASALGPGVHDAPAAHAGAQGEAAAERLPDANDVRVQPDARRGQRRTAPPHPGEHLVGHHKGPGGVGELGQSGHEPVGGDADPRPPLHRLHHHRADGVPVGSACGEDPFHLVQRLTGRRLSVSEGVGEGREGDPSVEARLERRTEQLPVRGRQRPQGEAVVCPLEGQEARAPRGHERRLQPGLHRLRARGGEDHAGVGPGSQRRDALHEKHLHRRRVDVPHAVDQALCLGGHRSGDFGVPVAQERHAEGPREVQEDVPVGVHHVGAPGLFPEHGPPLRKVGDVPGLHTPQPLRQRARSRAGWGHPELGEALAQLRSFHG